MKTILKIMFVLTAITLFSCSNTTKEQEKEKAIEKEKDIIVGNYSWGELGDYIINFQKDTIKKNFYIAKAIRIGSGNCYTQNQFMINNMELKNDSIVKGLVLVPINGDDSLQHYWYNFDGKISKNIISITIGEQKWGWGFKKIIN